jgi:carbonic anhydrase/acetyltransferase-like protein (isoleucine patch superfamily)
LTSIQDRCIVLGNVQIGEYCVFAPNIYISSGLHHFDSQPWALIKDQDEQAAARQDLAGKSAGQVVIEDDCWIGINVVVMRGVRVCKGAVIGANSVVTKDVSPYTVVAGAPASELRKRLNFRPPQAIQWDSDEDMPYFYSGFEISRVERARNKNLGGLAVRHAVFRIALACIEEAKIVVLAKLSQQGRPAQLRSGGVTHALSDEFRELAFPVVGKAQLHELEVHGLPRGDEARLIVKSAWLETD